MINFNEFLENGFRAQQEYAERAGVPGPLSKDLALERRYEKVIEHLSHLIEEVVETRMLVPRRSWKKEEKSYLDSLESREEFVYEMTDILLFFRAVLAYSGITIEEFERGFNKKMDYNKVREDHR